MCNISNRLQELKNQENCSIDLSYKEDLVISLTTYPARIDTVNQTIKTLLNQSFKPKKIVLVLGEDKFLNKENDLPENLKTLLNDKFEILWTSKDLRSYTKLIPTLKKYPNDIIVTADDDIIYPKDWLENLYNAYKKSPNMIHCHRAHGIICDKKKGILPYLNWNWEMINVKPSFNNFLTGVGGVLYPPKTLYKDILNNELFIKLCPTADDIWFWAMAVLNGTKINVVKNNYYKLIKIDSVQKETLAQYNVSNGGNDKQLQNVIEYYPQILKKLDKCTWTKRLFSITHSFLHMSIYILGIKFTFRIRKNK